jgi:hypothetical protein
MHFPTRHKTAPAPPPRHSTSIDSTPSAKDSAEEKPSTSSFPESNIHSPPPSHTRDHAPPASTSTSTNTTPHRPALQRRRTTARTRYIDMLLGLDTVSPLHNILASLSVWILLAGYIVFPATFNKLQARASDSSASNTLQAHALSTVRNVPLLYVAGVACGVGVLGCVVLWWKHRGNYVWVINRIFLPALLNSLAGLVGTFVNVYSAQDGTLAFSFSLSLFFFISKSFW